MLFDSMAFAETTKSQTKIQVQVPIQAQIPNKPVFKPRRNQTKLDLRPAIWSLKNHPEEWAIDDSRRYTIIHKPSKHVFWVADGAEFVSLYRAHCSCLSRNDRHQHTYMDRRRFWRAYRIWLRSHQQYMPNEQFAAHFIK